MEQTFVCISRFILSALAMAFVATRAQSTPCIPDLSVGLGIEKADSRQGVYIGQAADQVFFAPDTLLSTVTVWRSTTTGSHAKMQLFICEAETLASGEVRSKAIRGVIAVGPIIELTTPAPVAEPIQFVLDPPVHLPRIGQYAFAIRDAMECFGVFALEIALGNEYMGGDLWITGPTPSCGYGAYPGYPPDRSDLIFQIGFCLEPIPALPTSWGRIKTLYR